MKRFLSVLLTLSLVITAVFSLGTVALADPASAITINLSLKNFDDSVWTLNDRDKIPSETFIISPTGGSYDYKIEYSNGKVSEGNSSSVLLPLEDSRKADRAGSSSAVITLTNFEGNIFLGNINTNYVSKVIANGEVIDTTGKNIKFESATTSAIDASIYASDKQLVNGTFSFNSFDPSLADDNYELHFGFGFTDMENNQHIEDIYWIKASDASQTKHYPTVYDGSKVVFKFDIEMGDSITLYNIPLKVYHGMADAFPPKSISENAVDVVGPYLDEPLPAGTVISAVTLNGNNIDNALELGLQDSLYYTLDNGSGSLDAGHVSTSGSLSGYGIVGDFNMDVYLMPRNAQFVFEKAESTNDLDQKALKHSFQATITNPDGTPRTDKVAYFIVDSTEEKLDLSSVQYATPADGIINLEVPFGSYAILGYPATKAAFMDNYLRCGDTSANIYSDSGNSVPVFCIPSEGMLPINTKVKVAELTEDYKSTVVIGTESKVLDSAMKEVYSKDTDSYEYSISDFVSASGDVLSYFNVRKVASLVLSKTVTWADDPSDETFTIDLSFTTDSAFPEELLCEITDEGTVTVPYKTFEGSLIDGRKYYTYQCSVELKAGTQAKFLNIPSGTEYIVTEDLDGIEDEFTAIYSEEKGIVRDVTSIEITNVQATPSPTPTEEPTPTPTEEPTPTPTDEPDATPTPEPSVTPTEEPTVTPTEEPSVTPTEEPTVTPVVTPEDTPAVTPTEEPTVTPTIVPEEPTTTPSVTTPEPTPVITPVVSETPVPSVPMAGPNVTPAPEATATPTPTPTATPTATPKPNSSSTSTGENISPFVPAAFVLLGLAAALGFRVSATNKKSSTKQPGVRKPNIKL